MGKNETLAIYFMVRSTTEISYEVRFVCAISRGMRMVTDEKGHLEAVLIFFCTATISVSFQTMHVE